MFVTIANLLGTVICLLVALQAVAFLCRTLLGISADSRANQLRIDQLVGEIESLREQHRTIETSMEGWSGFRKFRVERKVLESDNTHSIYLVPHDGKSIPSFKPGQHLTFRFKVPGEEKPLVRCYSLSDGPGRPYYRCTIKQVPPPENQPDLPPGKASTFVNDQLEQGDLVDVKSPKGSFFMSPGEHPIVLLAGGIGITPMSSMLNAISQGGSQRKVILFYGVNHGSDHSLKQELAALCANHDNIEQVVCYSSPLPTDTLGRDFDYEGWVTLDLLKGKLETNQYEFYLCGPPPFMNSLVNGLESWSVPEDAIHMEAFGPASLKKKKKPATEIAANAENEQQPTIGFDHSKKQVKWNSDYESILDFAEAQGIEIESGCRAGNCGSCSIAIKSGRVKYTGDDHPECEEGSCLPCICVPDGELVLDA